MSPSNIVRSRLTTNNPSAEGFQPTKKARTSLSAGPASKKGVPTAGRSVSKKGASSTDNAPASKAPRLRAGRISKKGASSVRRTPSATSSSGGDSGDGDGASPDEGDSADLPRRDVAREPAGDAASSDEGGAALARVGAEIKALPFEETRRITVHVPLASMMVLGALPKMRVFREAMIAELVSPPIEALDKLHDYALAAAHAHACLLLQDDGETRVRALLAEASPMRERLLLSAELLANFGLLDGRIVADIRRGTGRLDTAQDLSALATLFLGAWSAIASKTPFTRADIERAAELGGLLLEALGRQQQRTDGSDEPGELEAQFAKAYELFRRAYEACRHAIVYIRRNEGDADTIAPPLGQSRRRPRRAEADEPTPTEPAPAEPAPTEPAPVDQNGEADAG